jgi:tetratricopeptide (TPR) repeat protein
MKSVIYLTLAAFMATAGLSTAFSAGSGTSGGTPTTNAPNPKKTCKKGEVYKKVKNKWSCVKATAGILPDDELYEQGRLLAKSGEYDWALEVLAAVENQNDPRVLNYTGYSNRKAGRLELGITYYNKALAIDPNFVLAREYLGEGYVAAGRIDLAQAQLTEIGNRCGATCSEYKDLAKAIATAQ